MTRPLCLLLVLACASCKSPEEQAKEDAERLERVRLQEEIKARKVEEKEQAAAELRDRDRKLEDLYDRAWAECVTLQGLDECREIGEAMLWRCRSWKRGEETGMEGCAEERFDRRGLEVGWTPPEPEASPEAEPPAEDRAMASPEKGVPAEDPAG